MNRSLNEIPKFLVAGSPRGLRRLMLRNNVRYQRWFQYFDIQNVGGKWYAWFWLNIEREVQKEERDARQAQML